MSVLVAPVHHHAWRIAEIEYLDGESVRRLECTCGAVDYAGAC